MKRKVGREGKKRRTENHTMANQPLINWALVPLPNSTYGTLSTTMQYLQADDEGRNMRTNQVNTNITILIYSLTYGIPQQRILSKVRYLTT